MAVEVFTRANPWYPRQKELLFVTFLRSAAKNLML
jgi:hypothetical protein